MASRGTTYHGGYSGALLAPFRYVVYLTLLLALLLLVAWVIDAFLAFKVWPNGIQTLELAVRRTAAASNEPYGIPLLRAQGVGWARGLYHALFVASAIEQIVVTDPRQLTAFDQAIQRFFLSLLPALQVAMLATKLYGLRLAIWLSAILPLVLGYAVGMIDGLVERSIRRHSGGRESATLYHRAKYAIASVVAAWLFTYVSIPITLELDVGTYMAAGAIGVMSRLQWKYYKKYL